MRITLDEVQHIALLARIRMTDQEMETMRREMSNILENFDVLAEVDVEGVEPTGHFVNIDTVMRSDEVENSLPSEDVLANAPTHQGEFIRTKGVLG